MLLPSHMFLKYAPNIFALSLDKGPFKGIFWPYVRPEEAEQVCRAWNLNLLPLLTTSQHIFQQHVLFDVTFKSQQKQDKWR